MTVLGLKLGEDFNAQVPECEIEIGSDYDYLRKEGNVQMKRVKVKKYKDFLGVHRASSCYKRNFERAGDDRAPITADPPTLRIENAHNVSGIASFHRVIIIDGRLEGITVGTEGLDYYQTIHDALLKKYGEPNEVAHIAEQNRMGATFDNKIEIWRFAGLTVTYIEMIGSLNGGSLEIITDAGRAELERRKKAEVAKEPGI